MNYVLTFIAGMLIGAIWSRKDEFLDITLEKYQGKKK